MKHTILLSLILLLLLFIPTNLINASEHVEIISIADQRVDFLWLDIEIRFFDYDFDGFKDSFDLIWFVAMANDDTESRSFMFFINLYLINDTTELLLLSEDHSKTLSRGSSIGKGSGTEIFHMNDTGSYLRLDWLFRTSHDIKSVWVSSNYYAYDSVKRAEMIELNSSLTDDENPPNIIPQLHSDFYLNPVITSDLDVSSRNLNYIIGIVILVILILIIFVIRKEY